MTLKEFKDSLSLKQKFNVDVLWNIGSLAILGTSGIVMNLIIVGYLGSEALGIFNQVCAIYIILSMFAVGGLHFSVLKNVAHNQDDPLKCAELASAGLVLICVLSSVIGLGTFLFADVAGILLQSPGVALGLRLIAPGLVFFALNKALLMTLNGMRHMRAFAIFQAMRYILIVSVICLLIFLGYPGSYLAVAFTVAELILLVGLLTYVNSQMFRLTVSRRIRGWFASHISFGLRGFMTGVFTETNTRVDILMLGYFLTDSMVGVYSFAAVLAQGIALLSYVVRQNIDPILGRNFAKETIAQIPVIVRKVRKVFYPVMGLIGVTAVLGYPLVFGLLVHEPGIMKKSWGVFSILITGIVINSGYQPFLGVFIQGGRPGFHTLFIGSLVLSNIILNAILIPFFGIFGAATATSLVFVLEGVFLVVSARKLFGLRL